MLRLLCRWRHYYHFLRDPGLHRARGNYRRTRFVPSRAASTRKDASITNDVGADPAGAGVRPVGGLVGAGRAAVRDAGGAAALRGRQRGRPVRVHPARRRAVPRVAVQGRRVHPEGLHDQEPLAAPGRGGRRRRHPRARLLQGHGLGGVGAAPPAPALPPQGGECSRRLRPSSSPAVRPHSRRLLQKSRLEAVNFDAEFTKEEPVLTPVPPDVVRAINQVRVRHQPDARPCGARTRPVLTRPPSPQEEFRGFSFVNGDFNPSPAPLP